MSNGDGTFTERAAALGIGHTGQGRGVVCTDYDADGAVDIFVAKHGAAPTVYRNVLATGNHWLAVDLEGHLDGVGGPALEARILAIVKHGDTRAVLDCARMRYVSSAGLRAILVGAKTCQ